MNWPNLQPLVDAGAFYIRVQAIESLSGSLVLAAMVSVASYAFYRFIRFIAADGKRKSK